MNLTKIVFSALNTLPNLPPLSPPPPTPSYSSYSSSSYSPLSSSSSSFYSSSFSFFLLPSCTRIGWWRVWCFLTPSAIIGGSSALPSSSSWTRKTCLRRKLRSPRSLSVSLTTLVCAQLLRTKVVHFSTLYYWGYSVLPKLLLRKHFFHWQHQACPKCVNKSWTSIIWSPVGQLCLAAIRR